MAEQPPQQDPASRIEDIGETSAQDERVAELIEHTIDVNAACEIILHKHHMMPLIVGDGGHADRLGRPADRRR